MRLILLILLTTTLNAQVRQKSLWDFGDTLYTISEERTILCNISESEWAATGILIDSTFFSQDVKIFCYISLNRFVLPHSVSVRFSDGFTITISPSRFDKEDGYHEFIVSEHLVNKMKETTVYGLIYESMNKEIHCSTISNAGYFMNFLHKYFN